MSMMTTPKETTPPSAPSTEDKGPLTAGTLRAWIKEEIGNLIPGKTPATSTQDTPQGTSAPDVKSQVAQALQELKTKEDRKARDERVDKMLTEYEKPKEEAAPVERRKVEKWMRWE